MKANRPENLSKYILPLNMNDLQGRMLRVPAPSSRAREILLVYGHHASLERWFGLAHELNKYGGVTMPDLPGFGGMDRFYKIGEKPTLNNYADYLAAFIKLRYKQRRLVIVAEGFGFLVATRMLMRYPNVARKVDFIAGLAGFSHKDDLLLSGRQRRGGRWLGFIFGNRLLGWLLGIAYIKPFLLKAYGRNQPLAKRLLEATVFPAPAIAQKSLWEQCDLATHLTTIKEMLSVDNCQTRLKVPLWNVILPKNQFLNEHFVEQHLKVTFEKCHFSVAKVGRRQLYDTSQKVAAKLLPVNLRRRLSRN